VQRACRMYDDLMTSVPDLMKRERAGVRGEGTKNLTRKWRLEGQARPWPYELTRAAQVEMVCTGPDCRKDACHAGSSTAASMCSIVALAWP
jgi:hypothetical protein